jgi:hypothetical protein
MLEMLIFRLQKCRYARGNVGGHNEQVAPKIMLQGEVV